MLKEQAKLFSFLNRITDHLLILLSIGFAIVTEQLYHNNPISLIDEKSFHPIMVPIILIFWQILFQLYDKENLYRRTNYISFIIYQLLIVFFGFSFLIGISFLSKTEIFYRTTIIAFSFFSFTFLLSKRWLVKFYLENIRKKGRNTRYIMIIGSMHRAQKLINEFEHHEEYGYVISHILDPDLDLSGKLINGHKIGLIDRFDSILLSDPIDEVFFALPPKKVPNFTEKLDFLNNLGINFHVMINLDAFSKGIQNLHVKPFMDQWYNIPVISFHPTDKKLFRLLFKTYFEFIIVIGILLFFSPILLITPILIKLSSSGPVFFSQERVGYHGRKFNLLKFRTMILNAESQLESLKKENTQSGPAFKMDNDPRVTTIGKFLRKYSLDELPQLYNVLIGDMNLVGPRPPLPSEVKQYKPEWRKRLNMKPGITGLWQVSGRNDITDFKDWVKLDLKYIKQWSLKLDLMIILKTIPQIFKGSGK